MYSSRHHIFSMYVFLNVDDSWQHCEAHHAIGNWYSQHSCTRSVAWNWWVGNQSRAQKNILTVNVDVVVAALSGYHINVRHIIRPNRSIPYRFYRVKTQGFNLGAMGSWNFEVKMPKAGIIVRHVTIPTLVFLCTAPPTIHPIIWEYPCEPNTFNQPCRHMEAWPLGR